MSMEANPDLLKVRLQGVRLNGKPVCNRFVIEYANGVGHIEFTEDNAQRVERAVNCYDQLAAENVALRDALQSLRTRLQACVAFYVHEAYDSFYQELVDEALSPAPAKKENERG